jgi:heme-degrading monooxygenase HmoA
MALGRLPRLRSRNAEPAGGSRTFSQELPLFARVSTYEVPPDQAREATQSFEQALGQIRGLKGLAAAYLLVNSESGRVLTMTLWDSAATMEASHVTASRLRTEAVRTVDGSVLSIEEYEVAARELGDVA